MKRGYAPAAGRRSVRASPGRQRGEHGSMEFHEDHSAFEETTAATVEAMYVPGADDHGIGDGTDHDGGEHDGGTDHDGTDHDGTDHDGGEHDGGTVSVTVGGHEV